MAGCKKKLIALKTIALPFFDEREPKLIIVTELDLDEVYLPIKELFVQMLVLFFMMVIILLPFEFYLGSLFVKPIADLHAVVNNIIAGDMNHKIEIKTADEIEWLGESFMVMMNKLQNEQLKLFNEKTYSQGIINSVVDSLVVVNLDGRIKLLNKAILNLLGYKEAELIGQSVKKIFLEEQEGRDNLPSYIQEIIKSGIVHNVGLSLVTKQGKRIPVNFSGEMMLQDGKINSIVGVARDMRQIMSIIHDLEEKKFELEVRSKNLIRMQRAMLHMMNDLQEASYAKGQFTSMVSHELRTPLSAIKEGVAVVLDRIIGDINDEQSKYLSIVKNNVDRLSRLINTVLDFQKLESGKTDLLMENSDINVITKSIYETMISLFTKKGLVLELKLCDTLPQVKMDKDKIIQVLMNLVNNAFKFTDKGSVIITTDKRDNFIQVAVKDTGPGIKEEDLSRLFQQFMQLQRKVGGTGIGLSICKKIIQMHKGRIWVESEFGKGSTFYFTLPI